jgi:steroid delta-isomerase
MTVEHPARLASQRSMAAVETGDRDGWLALFADDAVVEDPIGVSPLDPTGEGRHGKDAIAAFYDTVVAANPVGFEITASYAAGDEVANVGTITTTFPDGARAIVDGVYTYRVDGNGLITALRAYWEFDAMRFEVGPEPMNP